jgi:S1-C subfamily serine protease
MNTGDPSPIASARRRFSARILAARGRMLPVLGITALLTAFLAGCDLGANTTSTSSAEQVGQGAAPTVVVPPAAQDLQQTVINVIRTVQPSVVEVQSQGGQGGGIGSGEIITSDGYILTNDHVVRGFNQFSVRLANGAQYPAQLRGESPQDDLAVLKINVKNLHPIPLGDSSKVQVGQFAIAVGTPLGLEQSATFGIVSALNRDAYESPSIHLVGLIQTSAPINPGNSGGALVDLQGQLIGVPTLAASNPQTGAAAEGIGFAIPVNRVKFVAQQLIQNGRLVNSGQGFLGISGSDVTPENAAANNLPVDHGVVIISFANDVSGKSPAQQGGIKTGDIIVAIDGTQVNDSGDLSNVLLSKQPGSQVRVDVIHANGSKATLTVTLGERPANG